MVLLVHRRGFVAMSRRLYRRDPQTMRCPRRVTSKERSRLASMVVLVEDVGVERQRPTIANRLLGAVGRPYRTLDEVPGEHVPRAPVAGIFEVLLVPPQSSRVDDEHLVDGRVHQAVASPTVAIMRSAPRLEPCVPARTG